MSLDVSFNIWKDPKNSKKKTKNNNNNNKLMIERFSNDFTHWSNTQSWNDSLQLIAKFTCKID